MEELDVGIGDVSGGLSFMQFVASWIGTYAMDQVVSAAIGYVAAGGPPDYGNTTAMGDMY